MEMHRELEEVAIIIMRDDMPVRCFSNFDAVKTFMEFNEWDEIVVLRVEEDC